MSTKKVYAELRDELDRLRAENARLREALKPITPEESARVLLGTDIQSALRDVRARVYADWATNPATARQMADAFGNRFVDMEVVRRDFGDEAAETWLRLREAQESFLDACAALKGDEHG